MTGALTKKEIHLLQSRSWTSHLVRVHLEVPKTFSSLCDRMGFWGFTEEEVDENVRQQIEEGNIRWLGEKLEILVDP